jgi:hypothetical protein
MIEMVTLSFGLPDYKPKINKRSKKRPLNTYICVIFTNQNPRTNQTKYSVIPSLKNKYSL